MQYNKFIKGSCEPVKQCDCCCSTEYIWISDVGQGQGWQMSKDHRSAHQS